MRQVLSRVMWAASLSALLVSIGCSTDQETSPTNITVTQLPGPVAATRRGAVPDQYIVVLNRDVRHEDVLSRYGITPRHTYTAALNGFAAKMSRADVEALSGDPRVARIEADQYVYATEQDLNGNPVGSFKRLKGKPGGGPGKGGGGDASAPAQRIPTGVDRIDADQSPTAAIDGNDARVDADVAILDTGVDLDHSDLNVVGDVNMTGKGKNGDDRNGHGTHVAGTVAALDNGIGVVGVAPGARIWAVKVLGNDGSGYLSDVLAGIDYVTQNAATFEVANLSLGGPDSPTLNDAIATSVSAGVVYVVAAGNDAMDAAGTSPANSPDVLAVSAIADSDGACGGLGSSTAYGADDTFASFSNYGSAVDLAAPGVDILSTFKGNAYAVGSGTSMAAPHVAGVVALYRATHPGATVAEVRSAVEAAASPQTSGCGFAGDPDGNAEPVTNASAF